MSLGASWTGGRDAHQENSNWVGPGDLKIWCFFVAGRRPKKITILKPYNLGKTPLNWAYFVPKTLKYTKKNPACGGPKYTNFGQNRLYTLISKRTPPPPGGGSMSQLNIKRTWNQRIYRRMVRDWILAQNSEITGGTTMQDLFRLPEYNPKLHGTSIPSWYFAQ